MLLLVDAQPVGVAQHLLHVGVLVGDRLAPVLAVGVVVVHVGRHRPGPVQGLEGGDVLELRRGQRSHQVRAWGRPRAGRSRSCRPCCSISYTAGSSRGTLSMSIGLAACGPRMRSRARSITERLRSPRKSILSSPSSSTPCISYWVTMGASSGLPPGSGLRWIGQVVGERVARDHHRGGVDAVLAAHPLEPPGHVDDLGGVGVGGDQLAQLDRPACSRRGTWGARRGRPTAGCRGPSPAAAWLGDPVAERRRGTRAPGRRRARRPGP